MRALDSKLSAYSAMGDTRASSCSGLSNCSLAVGAGALRVWAVAIAGKTNKGNGISHRLMVRRNILTSGLAVSAQPLPQQRSLREVVPHTSLVALLLNLLSSVAGVETDDMERVAREKGFRLLA